MKTNLLKDGERLDDLGRKGYQIIQNPGSFCFGIDAVLLSDFAKVKPGQKVIDLGTGTGIIPILMEAKTEASHLTGLEIQPESADMARRSVQYNNLEDKIDIVMGDIKEASTIFEHDSFDVVTSNPPYMIGTHGLQGDNDKKTIARHEVLCTFDDIAREASRLLKNGGTFYLVHRPFRLIELVTTLTKYHLEPKRMRLVHPFVDKEPNMVLIEAKKCGNSRVAIEAPLIVYKEPGAYSDEILKIYNYKPDISSDI